MPSDWLLETKIHTFLSQSLKNCFEDKALKKRKLNKSLKYFLPTSKMDSSLTTNCLFLIYVESLLSEGRICINTFRFANLQDSFLDRKISSIEWSNLICHFFIFCYWSDSNFTSYFACDISWLRMTPFWRFLSKNYLFFLSKNIIFLTDLSLLFYPWPLLAS